MKKITSILAFVLALTWVSCNKETIGSINEITDHYTVPEGAVELTSLSKSESTWSLDRRYFDLAFTGNGATLETRLVAFDALLAPFEYVLGADEIGNAIAANTKLNGQSVNTGYVLVTKKDKDYQVIANLDGKAFVWTGSFPFTQDPEPLVLSVVQQAQANKDNKLVTMQLATEGISQEFDMTTYQNVWKGEGKYLALDLYSEDGYLHDGQYRASAQGGVVNAGEFGIGYDATVEWGDQTFTMPDWGTCLWTVSGGAATAEKITAGLVNVTSREEKVDDKDVTIWTIYWGEEFPKELIFEGPIPALTKPKKPSGPVNPDYLYTETITPNGEGVENHAFDITDKNNTLRAHIELLMAAGETDYDGAYPSTSYSSEPGQMVDGWVWGDFGGGSYWINDSGEKVLLAAGQYTMNVTKIAEGAYNFTCELFNYDAAGPDFVPGGDDDVTGDVVLKLTSGLTYTMTDVTSGNTAADGSALSGMTLWRVSVLNGADEVAEFDLGTAEGSQDLAGTYTVMSYPDAVGKAGNGWGFIPWMKGGCYFVVEGNYYWIPSDSTIKVSNNADGTLKIKFEGAIQNSDNTDGGQGGLLLNNIAKS